MIELLIFTLCLAISPALLAAEKIPELVNVPISFQDSLDPFDTTASSRFKKDYEGAVLAGTAVTRAALAQCGYRLMPSTDFYPASDPLQAMINAEKSQTAGAWLIVGPRRSQHYLLTVKGAQNTPTVSTMATSDAIGQLGNLHLSMVPPNSVMAETAAREVMASVPAVKSSSFVSIVAKACLYCREFHSEFTRAMQGLGIPESKGFFVDGDEPDLTAEREEIAKLKPSFILLPNYSLLTGYLIANLRRTFPDAFFVGGDGWGESTTGFVKNGRDISTAAGFCVRGNPPYNVAMSSFPLGQQATKFSDQTSAPTTSRLIILKIMEGLSNLLCSARPKSRQEFLKVFEQSGHQYFRPPWGVSIYELKSGDIAFRKSVVAE
jgi:hypothetical protein